MPTFNQLVRNERQEKQYKSDKIGYQHGGLINGEDPHKIKYKHQREKDSRNTHYKCRRFVGAEFVLF